MTNNFNIQQKLNDLIKDRINQEPEEQIHEAVRIISEIENIDSKIAFTKVQGQIQKGKQAITLLNMLSRIAAMLFIPLLIASAWLFFNPQKISTSQFAIQEITSPPGTRSQVVLPDGSKVWLNAESTIKFSIPFQEESRDIDLQGEAFFDVAKNPEQPFIVQSGNVKVKVLGTRFNFKSFAEDKNIEVVLEEGKISLNLPGKTGTQEAIMEPGDRAVIEKESGKATIGNENINKYIAWHSGKLVFDNTPMSEVARLLERWYGIEVNVQDSEIMNYRFTTTFENESLFQVIELLGLSSPIRIEYIPASIGKNNQTRTKSKVQISKKNKSNGNLKVIL
jgi:transmembrane sensor